MWEFLSKIWTDLKMALVAYFAKEAGKAEITKEHKEAADAARDDFEAIDGDGRDPTGAFGRLRARRGSTKGDPGGPR
jgi:hypothetical protein